MRTSRGTSHEKDPEAFVGDGYPYVNKGPDHRLVHLGQVVSVARVCLDGADDGDGAGSGQLLAIDVEW